MLIDTHCHLDFKDFDNDRDSVIARAKAAGVARIVNVASSVEGSSRSVELARDHDIIYASVGVHPHDAKIVTDEIIENLRAIALSHKKVVAIGEVGLDYYRNLSPKDIQIEAFRKFIRLAAELKLPLILHAREAEGDILKVLKEEARKLHVKAVMHCFSGGMPFLKECLDMGFYLSFTANLTFKNAKDLRVVAKAVPVERLFIETDAPFLAPEKLRGKRNEPSYLVYLIEEWSRILGLSQEDIARITTHNANQFFGLGLEDRSKIAYEIRDSLYLNITNRCTNMCDFCVRSQTEFVKGHNLKLEGEPTIEEILDAVGNPAKYKEVVFCGYGEPTLRLDVIKAVSRAIKKQGAKIRVVTNGHGDIINGHTIANDLAGLVDRFSVSLNTDTSSKYNDICKPEFGPDTYGRILDFIRSLVHSGIEVEVTCLDLPGVDIKRCEAIAREMGVKFRLRSLGVVG